MSRDPFLENGGTLEVPNMSRDCHDRWANLLGPWGTLEVPKMSRDGHDPWDTALGPLVMCWRALLYSVFLLIHLPVDWKLSPEGWLLNVNKNNHPSALQKCPI